MISLRSINKMLLSSQLYSNVRLAIITILYYSDLNLPILLNYRQYRYIFNGAGQNTGSHISIMNLVIITDSLDYRTIHQLNKNREYLRAYIYRCIK